jgi:hypothetical protein
MSIMNMVSSSYSYLSSLERLEVAGESERQAEGAFTGTTIVEEAEPGRDMPQMMMRT